VEAHEAFERFENTHHGAEGHEVPFASRAAMLVAVMAAFLAVATFKANEAVKDAIQTQTKLASTHADSQTAVGHQIQLELAYAQLSATAAGLQTGGAQLLQAAKKFDTIAKQQVGPEIKRLGEEATAQKNETNDLNHQHLLFELAEVGLQIGIVLASVSIIARRRWLLGLGALGGTVGVVIMVAGFLAS
jgi:preprotein translocase subunit SecF